MHCGYPCLSQPPRQPLPHPTPLQQHTQRSLPYQCRTVPNHTPHPTLTQPFVIEPHPFPPGSIRVQQSLKNYGYCEIPVATSTYYVLRYTYLPRLYQPPRNKLSLSLSMYVYVSAFVCVRALLGACWCRLLLAVYFQIFLGSCYSWQGHVRFIMHSVQQDSSVLPSAASRVSRFDSNLKNTH